MSTITLNDTATLHDAAEEFLSRQRIAVAGVSRDPKQPANLIYRRLRESGHEVVAVNPKAGTVEGDPCYPSLLDVPRPVDGVVIVTPPEQVLGIVEDCEVAGVPRVWLHRGMGSGSSSERAVDFCHEHGIAVIPSGCPCMFGVTSDAAHRGMLRVLRVTGKLPRAITYQPK